jgi:hypothetical protein
MRKQMTRLARSHNGDLLVQLGVPWETKPLGSAKPFGALAALQQRPGITSQMAVQLCMFGA